MQTTKPNQPPETEAAEPTATAAVSPQGSDELQGSNGAPESTPHPNHRRHHQRCHLCSQDLPLEAFRMRTSGLARRLECKACISARRRAARSQTCQRCAKLLPLGAFRRDARCQSGRRSVCKTCASFRGHRPRDLNVPDEHIPHFTTLRDRRIDLGIAIAHATCAPGECRTREEIAAYTGLTVEAVRQIELRALARMRTRAWDLLVATGLQHLVQIAP